jgi:hypothetical protein
MCPLYDDILLCEVISQRSKSTPKKQNSTKSNPIVIADGAELTRWLVRHISARKGYGPFGQFRAIYLVTRLNSCRFIRNRPSPRLLFGIFARSRARIVDYFCVLGLERNNPFVLFISESRQPIR